MTTCTNTAKEPIQPKSYADGCRPKIRYILYQIPGFGTKRGKIITSTYNREDLQAQEK